MGSIGTNLRLTGAAFKLVFQYPIVLVLPVFTLLYIGALVVGPVSFFMWQAENHPQAAEDFWKTVYFLAVDAAEDKNYNAAVGYAIGTTYVLWAIWMTFAFTGTLFFTTVGMHVATTQIRSGKPDLAQAFRLAARNLHRIFLMALFLATVYAWINWAIKYGPLRWIPFAGKWIIRGLKLVLTAVTYLMLPIIIYERAGPWNAFRSAWKNVRKTWSGLVIGTGFVFFAVWLLFSVFAAGLVKGALGTESWGALIPSIVLGGILYSISISVGAAMRAVLYWYATTGEVPAGFNRADLPTISAPGPITAVGAVAMAGVPAAAPPPAPSYVRARGPTYAPPPGAPRQAARVVAQPAPPPRVVAPAAPPQRPASAQRQQMGCPRCHTVIVVAWGAKPVCPTCGYGQ